MTEDDDVSVPFRGLRFETAPSRSRMPSGFSAHFAGQNENWPPSGSQCPVDYPHSRILPDAGQNRRIKGLHVYYTMECGTEQPQIA